MATGTSTFSNTVQIEDGRGWMNYPGVPVDIVPTGNGPLDITPTANRRGPARRAIATAVAVAAGSGLLAGMR